MEPTTDHSVHPTTLDAATFEVPSVAAGIGAASAGGPWTDASAGANPYAALPPGPPTPEKQRFTLRRSRTDRMLGGVCGGLAESLGVDATMLRILLVVLTVLGFGAGVVLYAAIWILAPEAD
ncbi:PspC domain-containing protein [Pseudonocardia asaccharolytica]|nr:PspC domain-containing protein [Pseudonocardia asaccharolytica]